MLKELFLCIPAVSMSAMPSRQANTRSHVVEQDGMAITYKYETNEVNSNNDLISGHAYRCSIIDLPLDSLVQHNTNDFYMTLTFFNVVSYDFTYLDLNLDDTIFNNPNEEVGNIVVSITVNYNYSYIDIFLNNTYDYLFEYYIDMGNDFSIVGDCLFYGNYLQDYAYQHFSICENIPIESVERVYPDNIFGYVSEFIDEHILEGIPNIDNVSYTIGGQNITMRSWLNTSICVVLAILLISLLIFFVRYIFRLFSSLLH